jgi:histidine ammonia-lyase
MPVAVKLYNLVQACAITARLSNMRCVRYVDQSRNKGLGSDLKWPGLSEKEQATSSGMMIPEYVTAALTNDIWGKAMPSHLFSLSTDAGQEDFVSMSATLGVRVFEMLARLEEILAIELAFAHQASEIRKFCSSIPSKSQKHSPTKEQRAKLDAVLFEISKDLSDTRMVPRISVDFEFVLDDESRSLSPVCEKVLTEIRRHFGRVEKDTELSTPLAKLTTALREGLILKAVSNDVWQRDSSSPR